MYQGALVTGVDNSNYSSVKRDVFILWSYFLVHVSVWPVQFIKYLNLTKPVILLAPTTWNRLGDFSYLNLAKVEKPSALQALP